MKLDYKQLLALIFPPSSDELLVQGAKPQLFSSVTLRRRGDTYFLLPFAEPTVRAAIHLAKFHHHPLALKLLAAALESALAQLPFPDPLIIPIPLSRVRYKERGYNQVVEIIRSLPRPRRPDWSERVLRRSLNRPPQSGLSRAERRQNMRGVYALAGGARERVRGRHLILLDDVTTSGATLAAAKATLQDLPYASLTCLALAH